MTIVAENLGKTFGKKQETVALESINLTVPKGSLFGLIGPDGAGKTTLIRILVTLLVPDQGRARVHGKDVVKDYRSIRRLAGYMPGRFALYQDLSVKENLNLFTTIFGTTLEASYHLIKDIYSQLEPFANRKAGDLSGGMKQKLALCCTLSHQPEVLFLDEPTTGVDAVSRREFWEMLHKLKKAGMTILVSTPYMDEASQCDQIALMNEGKILSVSTPSVLIEKYPHRLWSVKAQNMYMALLDLQKNPGILSCYTFGSNHHVTCREQYSGDRLSQYLTERGHSQIEVDQITPSIEDCFMDLLN